MEVVTVFVFSTEHLAVMPRPSVCRHKKEISPAPFFLHHCSLLRYVNHLFPLLFIEIF